MPIVDRTGQKFGKLTVIEMVPKTTRKTFWKCICECGNEKIVRSDHLTDGHTQSCGCYNVESSITHGKKDTRLYKIYWGMIYRCQNKKDHNYGGRGISVCEEWKADFMSFYNWAISNGYSDDKTLDRINNSLNYSPDNCRWATKIQQDRNKRTNVFVPYDDRMVTLIELSEIVNINYNTICNRYSRGDRNEKLIRPVQSKQTAY